MVSIRDNDELESLTLLTKKTLIKKCDSAIRSQLLAASTGQK